MFWIKDVAKVTLMVLTLFACFKFNLPCYLNASSFVTMFMILFHIKNKKPWCHKLSWMSNFESFITASGIQFLFLFHRAIQHFLFESRRSIDTIFTHGRRKRYKGATFLDRMGPEQASHLCVQSEQTVSSLPLCRDRLLRCQTMLSGPLNPPIADIPAP